MTKEEYIKRMKEDNEWAPGWEAIDAEFDRLYPGQKPAHFGTNIQSRAMFGGDEYLDGFSVYDMGNGCRRIHQCCIHHLQKHVHHFHDLHLNHGLNALFCS